MRLARADTGPHRRLLQETGLTNQEARGHQTRLPQRRQHCPSSQVEYEPLILQDPAQLIQQVYNDVRFSGSADANLPPMEFDGTSILVSREERRGRQPESSAHAIEH
jgi:hypothetical protein